MDELRALDWVPRSVRDRKNTLQRTTQSLTNKLGREPTNEELAQELDITPAELKELQSKAVVRSMISYEDLKPNKDSGRDVLESIPDRNQMDPASLEEQRDEQNIIYRALKELPDRQRMVLSLYYFEEMKLKDIGSLLGVSESRVSQIQSQAVAMLKPIIERMS